MRVRQIAGERDKDDAAKNRRVELRFVLAFQPSDNPATQGPSSALKRMQETVR